MRMLHSSWATIRRPVIGMLHLLPLPGSAQFGGSVQAIADAVLRDAEALVSGGVHGLMLENYGDVPFFPGAVPPHVIAHMTALAALVHARFDRPLGINVLRNDSLAALAVAHAAGASFIRVNILCGARVTDQGIIQGNAHELLRQRRMLGADSIKILADVDVKHSAPLAARALEDEVDDTIHRGLADALIVSGAGTGKATDPEQARRVKAVAGDVPVLIGSGVTAETVPTLATHCDGFIVGSSFKQDGIPTNPVEPSRVRELMRRLGC
jgi:membrane complex biogenesis BtpA family protein